jgi:hypothetical protein
MAARKGRLAIRGPSSPDLGQERPGDRLRPGALVDLGIRDDSPLPPNGARQPAHTATHR